MSWPTGDGGDKEERFEEGTERVKGQAIGLWERQRLTKHMGKSRCR